jgi:trk system potassium uptake protein TrkA
LADRREPVLVIGLGRFGLTLARELTALHVPLLAVDARMEAVQHASFTVSNVVSANSTDMDALRQIGAADFSRAVVAIGSNMEASILTVSLLADLGVERIWAKASTTQHARILERVGAHHVVQPEHDMGERVARLVSHRLMDYIEVGPGWALAKCRPPKDLVGIPLGGSKVRNDRRVTVVAVKHKDAEQFTHCDASTVLGYGDDIMVMGRPADVERFVDS